jgi:hemolysin III
MERILPARRAVGIPSYTVGEEIFNAVSHGLGALLGSAGLVLLVTKARGALAKTAVVLFALAIIQVYAVSCVYHALSPRCVGKKVLRVIDHCNVYVLVLCSYLPAALLGVGGRCGWVLLGIVFVFAVLGIVFTALDVDRYTLLGVICHLVSGWSILLGLPGLLQTMGRRGVGYLLLGGVMYSVGAILYGVGKKKRYRHSIFHVFCLLGTFFHFWGIYRYLL